MRSPFPLTILIVDDDPLDREICRSLISEGHRFDATVLEAESAQQAREIIAEKQIDCILLDNCLPDSSGTRTLKSLNSERETPVPAILFTGHFSPSAYEEALESGAYDLLIKGDISPESLERSIAFVLEKDARSQAQSDALKAVQEASELKSNFLAQVSHDIRNPLHQILNLAKFLKKNVNPCSPEKQEDYVARIRSAGQSVLTYVDRLLDLAKMESGRMVPVPQTIPLGDFLKNLIKENSILIREKKLDLLLEITEGAPDVIHIDPAFLSQMINNLVGNAVKFTKEGAVKIIVSSAQPDYLSVAVEDTGIGMEEDHIKKVFEPYIQASPSMRKEYGGSGLGLAIVKETVELLDATLAVTSTPNEGSKFTITFSHASAPPKTARDIPVEPEGSSATPTTLRHLEKEVQQSHDSDALQTTSTHTGRKKE